MPQVLCPVLVGRDEEARRLRAALAAADAGVVVDAARLDAHLHDPAVRVVEVDVSRRAHDAWHIEGAVPWDVCRDLKDADYRPDLPARPRACPGPRRLVGRTGPDARCSGRTGLTA